MISGDILFRRSVSDDNIEVQCGATNQDWAEFNSSRCIEGTDFSYRSIAMQRNVSFRLQLPLEAKSRPIGGAHFFHHRLPPDAKSRLLGGAHSFHQRLPADENIISEDALSHPIKRGVTGCGGGAARSSRKCFRCYRLETGA